MGGLRTDVERLTNLVPDPQGQTAGLVPVVSTFVDSRGITQYTYTLQAIAPGLGQTKIQFQYNGANLGTSGSVDTYNVVSSTATFVHVGNTVTLTIPAGLASPLTTKGDLWGFSTVNARIPVGADGQIMTADSTQALGVKWDAAPSAGVTLTMPAEFSVSGSGTSAITVTKANESANTVWAGPTSGAPAPPTFRAPVAADLPVISTGAVWTVGVAGGPQILAVQFDVGKVPANYTVTGWQLEMDKTGTFSVEVQKATSGAFPTYSTMSGVSTSAGGLPAITSAQSASSSNVSLWSSTSIGIGDSIRLIIHANNASIGWFSLMLTASRTL